MLRKIFIGVLTLVILSACGSSSQPQTVTASGDITSAVDEYRALLGENNGGDPGTKGPTGYREINWDTIPDEFSAPNFYTSDFFNQPEAPRARGIVLSTPGEGLMVSANASNPNGTLPHFGNINPQYAEIFKTFSAEKLFSPIGSNLVVITFFVPGTDIPATVRGFGAVYADVDTTHTAFEYFDKDGNSLGKFETPICDSCLSFLGVAFDEAVIASVEVRYGTGALGPDDGAGEVDVAVMDNFIFGEPQAIK